MMLRLLLPDDVESFTSTCSNVYNLAAKDLERHRALKLKYAVYHHFDPHGSSPRCSLPQLLDEILQEPRLAFYVQELYIHSWWKRWGTHQSSETSRPEDLHLPYDAGSMSRLREAVSTLVPQEEVSRWLGYIESGNEDPLVSLLLLLLPNLSKLKLDYTGDAQECLYDTLYRIARMKRPDAPLSHLRHVQISHPWYSSVTVELKVIGLFAALPSVRSIHGLEAYAPNTEVDHSTELAPRTSNLEDLTLTSCLINPKRLYNFLESFKALRSFTCDWENRAFLLAESCPKFEPCRIRSGLFDFAKSTLESLTILSHNKKRNLMGDIRSFESLRNLHTETQLLLDGFDLRHDPTLLVRALPPKLETLKLECSRLEDERRLARWIFTLAELKLEFVPALREVEVLTRDDAKVFNTPQDDPIKECRTHEALVEACEIQGIHLLIKAFDAEAIKTLERFERKYCFCQRESDGTMIACSNADCRHGELFHDSCIGVQPTSSEWYCPGCLTDSQESSVEVVGRSSV